MSGSVRTDETATWLPGLMAVTVMALLLPLAIPLTQSDGDLFAHIAMGREILAHGPPARPTPAWGSAALLAVAHVYGGLPLVVAGTVVVAGLTHALAARLLVRAGLPVRTALVAAMLGVMLASAHWLARPHAFTLLGVALLMTVLYSSRRRQYVLLVPLFAVWANLHGGWVFGGLVLGAHTLGRTLSTELRAITTGETDLRTTETREARRDWQSRWLVTVGAMLATTATPYGIALHRTILSTLTDSTLVRYIDEWRPPSFASPVDGLFLVIVALCVPVLVARRRRIPLESALVILLSALSALRAGRDIALFAFTGWPLLVIHGATFSNPAAPYSQPAAVPRTRDTAHPWVLTGVVGALAFLVSSAAARSGRHTMLAVPVDSMRFPVGAVNQVRQARLPERLLTTWSWSGYVPYAWRGHRAWFDPLVFSPEELRALRILLYADASWPGTMDSLQIGVVIVPPSSPLSRALSTAPGWDRWYQDRTSVVYRRRASVRMPPSHPTEGPRRRG